MTVSDVKLKSYIFIKKMFFFFIYIFEAHKQSTFHLNCTLDFHKVNRQYISHYEKSI